MRGESNLAFTLKYKYIESMCKTETASQKTIEKQQQQQQKQQTTKKQKQKQKQNKKGISVGGI